MGGENGTVSVNMNTVDGVNACDLDKLLVDIKRMKNIGKRNRQLENYSLKKAISGGNASYTVLVFSLYITDVTIFPPKSVLYANMKACIGYSMQIA